MNGDSHTQQSIQDQNPEQNYSKNSKTGFLITLLLIGIGIILVLLILNYLKIINLSSIIPNNSLSQNTNKEQGNSFPEYEVDEELLTKVKQSVMEEISSVAQESVIPASDELTFVKSQGGEYDYVGAWTTTNGDAAVRATTSPDGSKLVSTYILFDYETPESANAATAEDAVSQFYKTTPAGSFSCNLLRDNINYCESFWEDKDGTKKGIGI